MRHQGKGLIGILNVGAGDTKLSFDPSKPAEVKRASRIVGEMLAQWYAILVQAGEENGEPLYRRAKGFDPKTCEYIIVGAPEENHEEAPSKAAKGRQTLKERRIPARSTNAIAVARTAGG